MIDLVQLRRDTDEVRAALVRRGVPAGDVDEAVALDVEHRHLLQESEGLRAQVKELSRAVAEARRAGDDETVARLSERSRVLGDEEGAAREATEHIAARLRERLLMIPNVPSPEAPDGLDEGDNVELRRWWPGADEGAPAPTYADHQRVAHWDIGAALGILDLEAGVRIAGSMFPLYRGDGARLVRALSSLSLDRQRDAYEEIRPPSFALTETMMSTGHLPKSSDDMYAIERDDLWAIPTAEVPLTSMNRGEILDESRLPMRFTAYTPCFRREAGAAGRDTRGLLRVHEFDKVELFAYCTPDQKDAAFDDILARAEALLRELGLTYRLVDLCCGDLGTSSARTIDLDVYSPGVDRWLEVSSVSWFRDYQARRANVRYRAADGSTALVHTVNGSALGFARVWAALVETYHTPEGTVELPAVLAPYLGGSATLTRRSA
ncbi:MAG: serine--tRNA ligase [Acidimicrobiales bacterium]